VLPPALVSAWCLRHPGPAGQRLRAHRPTALLQSSLSPCAHNLTLYFRCTRVDIFVLIYMYIHFYVISTPTRPPSFWILRCTRCCATSTGALCWRSGCAALLFCIYNNIQRVLSTLCYCFVINLFRGLVCYYLLAELAVNHRTCSFFSYVQIAQTQPFLPDRNSVCDGFVPGAHWSWCVYIQVAVIACWIQHCHFSVRSVSLDSLANSPFGTQVLTRITNVAETAYNYNSCHILTCDLFVA